jgi:hypothetical protein
MRTWTLRIDYSQRDVRRPTVKDDVVDPDAVLGARESVQRLANAVAKLAFVDLVSVLSAHVPESHRVQVDSDVDVITILPRDGDSSQVLRLKIQVSEGRVVMNGWITADLDAGITDMTAALAEIADAAGAAATRP